MIHKTKQGLNWIFPLVCLHVPIFLPDFWHNQVPYLTVYFLASRRQWRYVSPVSMRISTRWWDIQRWEYVEKGRAQMEQQQKTHPCIHNRWNSCPLRQTLSKIDDELVRWRDLIKISVAGLTAINSNVWENHCVTIQISRQIFLYLIKWWVFFRHQQHETDLKVNDLKYIASS